jgi:hypothetical protein
MTMYRTSEIWSHPRCDGPIQGLADKDGMAAEAAAGLARRIASYPAFIDAGKLDETAAAADIAAWRSIAADWQWIASNGGDGIRGDHHTLRARIAALDTAIDRFFTAMDRTGEKRQRPAAETLTPEQRRQITTLLAMRYWAEWERSMRAPDRPKGILHPRDIAQINNHLRARYGEVAIAVGIERKAA